MVFKGMSAAMRTHYMLQLMLQQNEDAVQRWVAALAKHLDTARFGDMLRVSDTTK